MFAGAVGGRLYGIDSRSFTVDTHDGRILLGKWGEYLFQFGDGSSRSVVVFRRHETPPGVAEAFVGRWMIQGMVHGFGWYVVEDEPNGTGRFWPLPEARITPVLAGVGGVPKLGLDDIKDLVRQRRATVRSITPPTYVPRIGEVILATSILKELKAAGGIVDWLGLPGGAASDSDANPDYIGQLIGEMMER